MHGCPRALLCLQVLRAHGDIQMENYSTFACNDTEVDEGMCCCSITCVQDCTIELAELRRRTNSSAGSRSRTSHRVVPSNP